MSKLTQDKIFRDLCEKHQIDLNQGEDVLHCLGTQISKIMEESNRNGGLVDITKFKVINIDRLGKFVPHIHRISGANKVIAKRLNIEE